MLFCVEILHKEFDFMINFISFHFLNVNPLAANI